MFIKDAFEAGLELKEAIEKKGDNLFIATYKLHNSDSLNVFLQKYAEFCASYRLKIADFTLKCLDGTYDFESARICFSYGLLLDKKDFLTTSKVAEKYNIDSSTVRKAIANNKFSDTEHFKSGKTWYVQKNAIEREFEEK